MDITQLLADAIQAIQTMPGDKGSGCDDEGDRHGRCQSSSERQIAGDP